MYVEVEYISDKGFPIPPPSVVHEMHRRFLSSCWTDDTECIASQNIIES